MPNICSGTVIKDDITCYASFIIPFIYGLLEIFCLYCSIRSCNEKKISQRSYVLILLYFCVHALIVVRVLYVLSRLLKFEEGLEKWWLLVLGYIKDLFVLMVITRVYETLDRDVSRERTTYKPWVILSIIFAIIYTFCYWAVIILSKIFNKDPDIIFHIYEASMLVFIELMLAIASLKFLRTFKESSPGGFNTVSTHIKFLFALMNLGVIVQICQVVLFNIVEIKINGNINPIKEIVLIVLTEFLPVIILLTYISKEYRNNKIGMLRLGVIVAVETLIEESDISEKESNDSG